MTIRQTLLALAFATGLVAGGPDIECDTIHIDNVTILGTGTYLQVTITGTLKVLAAIPPGEPMPDGDARWVKLSCVGAVLEISGFGLEKAASTQGRDTWSKRVMAMKGHDIMKLQGWDARIELVDGRVTRIIANTVYPFALAPSEMVFSFQQK
jgi:hypothetical protein